MAPQGRAATGRKTRYALPAVTVTTIVAVSVPGYG
jgi:hypothetical protein